MDGLPVAPATSQPGLITERLKDSLASEPEFPAAIAALQPPTDVPGDLLRLSTAFARIFLVHGRARPIGFLHAVTAPVAARSVLPLLPPEYARPTHDALWQTAAALYTAYAGEAGREPLPSGEPPAPSVLADRATATGDVHAIKLTEACLRLYSESPDPVLLHAAARGSELLA